MESERSYNTYHKRLAFVQAVQEALRSGVGRGVSFSEVCERVAKSPAPRFYLTAKAVLTVYYRYLMDKSLSGMSDLTKGMYRCIFERYEALLELDSTANRIELMSSVLEGEAPCWFIEPKKAHFYYYKALKETR